MWIAPFCRREMAHTHAFQKLVKEGSFPGRSWVMEGEDKKARFQGRTHHTLTTSGLGPLPRRHT